MRLIIKKDEARSGCRKDDPKEPPRESIMGDMDAAPMEGKIFQGAKGHNPTPLPLTLGGMRRLFPAKRLRSSGGGEPMCSLKFRCPSPQPPALSTASLSL